MTEKCFICYDDSKPSKDFFRPCTRTTKCNLWVHSDCIDEYANDSNFNDKCPGCKTKFEVTGKVLYISNVKKFLKGMKETFKIISESLHDEMKEKYKNWSNSSMKTYRTIFMGITLCVILHFLWTMPYVLPRTIIDIAMLPFILSVVLLGVIGGFLMTDEDEKNIKYSFPVSLIDTKNLYIAHSLSMISNYAIGYCVTGFLPHNICSNSYYFIGMYLRMMGTTMFETINTQANKSGYYDFQHMLKFNTVLSADSDVRVICINCEEECVDDFIIPCRDCKNTFHSDCVTQCGCGKPYITMFELYFTVAISMVTTVILFYLAIDHFLIQTEISIVWHDLIIGGMSVYFFIWAFQYAFNFKDISWAIDDLIKDTFDEFNQIEDGREKYVMKQYMNAWCIFSIGPFSLLRSHFFSEFIRKHWYFVELYDASDILLAYIPIYMYYGKLTIYQQIMIYHKFHIILGLFLFLFTMGYQIFHQITTSKTKHVVEK